MLKLGVFEIFFGAPWVAKERLELAKFLGQNSFDFYVYGPKADKFLRKEWRQEWPIGYRRELQEMASAYRAAGVRFGVALSPYGIGEKLGGEDRRLLEEKVRTLADVGVEVLGVFFDDMPVTPRLAESQLETLAVMRAQTRAQIVFCPTFYCFDPILEKVFGAKPDGYLETIADGLAEGIEVAWTGPKVISEEIGVDHLREVSGLLRRPPFLCDNFFANDGPKNCKFLKLKEPFGRSRAALASVCYWGLNPMNQIHLSKLALSAFKKMALDGLEPSPAFERAASELCSPRLSEFVVRNRTAFLNGGLEGNSEGMKREWMQALASFDEPIALEIAAWLNGRYQVGADCLTD